MAIKIASRTNARLRLAVSGVSGAGKTLSALKMAAALGGKRIGVIDSEKRSASLYVGLPGVPEFSTDEDFEKLESPTLADYQASIVRFAEAGCDVLIVDSLSHSWKAALEAVDRAGGWVKAGKTITPALAKLTNSLLTYPGHVIATMRSKMEFVVEKNEKGQNALKKVGLAPEVRADTEYEFTVFLDLVKENDKSVSVTVQKSRCGEALPDGSVFDRSELPKVAVRLRDWLAGSGISPRSEALERIRFAGDAATLALAAKWIAENNGSLSDDDRGALREAYLARKASIATDTVSFE